MLNFREEYELGICRENHLGCLLGWVTSLFFAFVCVLAFAWLGRPWLLQLAAGDLAIGILFFLKGRRPLRRIREIEQFL